MAATFNESQKIDYLWKKVGYGVAKTAEPTSKEAFNESIASPLLYRGDLVWTSSGDIPATPPTNTTSLVQVYKDGGGGGYSPTVECTEDLTAPDNQTWKTNLTNWVPTQFGDNYLVQVYVAASGITNPQTAGTKLFGAGSGSDDTWFFDYQSGVLNFNGATIPTQIAGGVTGKSIYIVGYRYVGEYGVDTTFISNGDSNVSIATANANVTISVNGTGNVAVFSNTGAYVSGAVSATGNITGGNVNAAGLSLSGNVVSALNVTGNITAAIVTTTGNVVATGNVNGANLNITSTGNINALVVPTTVVATGNITGGNLITSGVVTATGDINSTANVSGGNLTTGGLAVVTGNITAGNVNTAGLASVTGNVQAGNLRTTGLVSATGNVTAGNVSVSGVININGALAATINDAIALSIALG